VKAKSEKSKFIKEKRKPGCLRVYEVNDRTKVSVLQYKRRDSYSLKLKTELKSPNILE